MSSHEPMPSLGDRGLATVKMAIAAALAVFISSTGLVSEAVASLGGVAYAIAPAIAAAVTEALTYLKDKYFG